MGFIRLDLVVCHATAVNVRGLLPDKKAQDYRHKIYKFNNDNDLFENLRKMAIETCGLQETPEGRFAEYDDSYFSPYNGGDYKRIVKELYLKANNLCGQTRVNIAFD